MCLELRRHLRTVRDVSARALRRRERSSGFSATAADAMTRSVTVATLSAGASEGNAVAVASAERGARVGRHVAARAIAAAAAVGGGGGGGAAASFGAVANSMTMSMFVAPPTRSDSSDASIDASESCTRPNHSAASEDVASAESEMQPEEQQQQRDSASPPLPPAAAFGRPSTPEQLRQIELDWRLGALRGALDDLKQLLLDANVFANSNSSSR